ncbi:unnamed protein product [Pleuronectes platessa]|uniref:Uncharacterized protein n=1 Tax=Pleuronectes platessa TaxID=8262 RepID=A0A9N7VK22_PLEPL|nr:unnamed protein product [Pleuronectes platessa]
MAQELELSEHTTITCLQGTETKSGKTEPSERRLLRIGVVTLAVLCVLQAILNVSLRLALYSKEDSVQFPFNLSMLADLCEIPEPEQNQTQGCSCCKKQLRRLVTEYEALERERQRLLELVDQLKGNSDSGSGSVLEFDKYDMEPLLPTFPLLRLKKKR